MALVRLVYASKATENFSGAELNTVLAQSRANNRKNNVSGILWFNTNYILQVLEGSPEAVNTIYLKISRDPRHTALELLDYAVINKRDFNDWSMGYAPETKETRKIYLTYSAAAEFNPYELLGSPAIEFLRALANQLPHD